MTEPYIDHQSVLKMMNIARQNIKTARHALHLNQDKVATRMGIDLKTFANYEQGVTDIPLSRLFEIAQALGIEAAWLVCDKDSLLARVLPLLPKVDAIVSDHLKDTL